MYTTQKHTNPPNSADKGGNRKAVFVKFEIQLVGITGMKMLMIRVRVSDGNHHNLAFAFSECYIELTEMECSWFEKFQDIIDGLGGALINLNVFRYVFNLL